MLKIEALRNDWSDEQKGKPQQLFPIAPYSESLISDFQMNTTAYLNSRFAIKAAGDTIAVMLGSKQQTPWRFNPNKVFLVRADGTKDNILPDYTKIDYVYRAALKSGDIVQVEIPETCNVSMVAFQATEK